MENKKEPKLEKINIGAKGAEKINHFISGLKSSREISAKNLFMDGVLGIIYAFVAYLLGGVELAFGTLPLGIAFLCCATKRIPYIFLGLAVSALNSSKFTVVYISTCVIALSVRILSRAIANSQKDSESPHEANENLIPLFGESVYLRMATACISMFILGLYTIITGQFRYYDLFGALFSMITSPVAVFIYSGLFQELPEAELPITEKRLRELAIAGILFSITYALRDTTIIAISCGCFSAFFATLYVSKKKGLLKGLFIGILCGLAYNPIYAPLFAFAAVAAGSLFNISSFAAALSACIVGMVWGIYVDGVNVIATLFPALLSSAMIFCTFEKIAEMPETRDFLNAKSEKEALALKNAIAQRRIKSNEEKIKSLADAFSSLSEVMFDLGDRLRRPAVLDLRQMCDSTYDKFCPDCENKNVCWGIEYSETLDIINRLSSRLHTHGIAGEECIPQYMRKRCSLLPDIVAEINLRCSYLTEQALKSEKTEIFAFDYNAIAGILKDSLAYENDEYEIDNTLCERVTQLLSSVGYGSHSVTVYGKRKNNIIVHGLELSSAGTGVRKLREKLEHLCGFSMCEPTFELGQSTVSMSLSRRRIISARYAYTSKNAVGEQKICGDTISIFENKNDYFYILISDGMGSGTEAALASGISALFVQKMLSAGNKIETTLRMLNSFLRSKGNSSSAECSATIDLLQLDLLKSHATFIKSGAASTFCRRKDKIFSLSAKSIPIGILRAVDAKQLDFDVMVGDRIIMVSDGVTSGDTECPWLLELLSNSWNDNFDIMVKTIAEKAVKLGSTDDISVVIVGIEEYKEEL